MSKELAQQIFDSNIRIAGIWPIFGLSDSPSDTFTDAIEYADLPPEIAALIPDYGDDFDHDEIDWDEFLADAFNKGVHGYLIIADCPVFTPSGSGGASFSWGHWRTKLFYNDSVDAGITAAVAWGNKRFQAAIAEGGAS